MNIWNKVFLVLVFLLGIAVVFFASQEMKIRKEYKEAIASLETGIENAKRQMQTAIDGPAPDKATAEKSFDEMGLNEMLLKLQDLVFERSKAWFACKPGNVSVGETVLNPKPLDDAPETPQERLKPIKLVEVRLTITEPVIERDGQEVVLPPEDMKGIVYLFDEGQEGANTAFLGRFSVKQIRGTQVELTAIDTMQEAEIQRIQKSVRSTWAVYSVIPKDRQDGIFSRLTLEDAEALIAASKRSEMMNPERPLKDFDELLGRMYDWRAELQQRIDRFKQDVKRLETSLTLAEKETQDIQKDNEFEKKRIAAMKHQVEVLQQKLTDYDKNIEDLQKKIDDQQKQNEWYVAKIAEYQLKVANLIQDRAETAARE